MTDLGFTLERSYAAAPERVWAHFTEPDLMAQWFCPNPSVATTCTVDARAGGRWQCLMGGYDVGGTFLEVEPPRRLVFTFDWAHDEDPPTTVTVTLTPDGSGSRLLLEHAETEPEVGSEGHEGGWVLSLARLSDLLG